MDGTVAAFGLLTGTVTALNIWARLRYPAREFRTASASQVVAGALQEPAAMRHGPDGFAARDFVDGPPSAADSNCATT